jgi:hypothetical protein
MKPVRFSAHALSYTSRRGFTVEEVEDTIRRSQWEPAELRRWQSRQDFPFGQEWNGRVYTAKQVRPVFVEEETEIVVVTVYTYYF